jgi:hypothetical protein
MSVMPPLPSLASPPVGAAPLTPGLFTPVRSRGDESMQDGVREWLRQMRLLRAEAQDLRTVLADVRRGGIPLPRYVDYIRKAYGDMDALVTSIGDEDDCVRHVRNAWEQMRTCVVMREPDQQLEPQLQMQLLNLLDVQARRIIYWTCYRTIPDRLREWLRETQPGYAIPFHAVFEDELPEAEDRQRILNYLACTPEALKDVGGLVDPDNGLVYRYDPSPTRRWWSLAEIGVALVVLTALVVAAGSMVAPPLQPNWNVRTLLIGWLAVLVGVVVHAAVGMAKRLRAQSANPAVLPVGKAMILLNAKEGTILLRSTLALIGFMALAYASTIPEPAHFGSFMLNAFLVGYSLDSVIELFGTGMDQRAAALQSTLKAQLGTGA